MVDRDRSRVAVQRRVCTPAVGDWNATKSDGQEGNSLWGTLGEATNIRIENLRAWNCSVEERGDVRQRRGTEE